MATSQLVERTRRLIAQAVGHIAAAERLCATARETRSRVAKQVRRCPVRRGARIARGGSENSHPEPLQGAFRPRAGLSLFWVEIEEGDYLLLLRAVEKGTRLANMLVAAVRHQRRTRAGVLQDTVYAVRGARTDGLELRALAERHAPGIVPAIDKAINGIVKGYHL
jgi:hypothetical protein